MHVQKPAGVLRRHQGVLLELLEEFDRICGKYGIRYQLFAGSALGAVRHGGIIPWDDDLDVVMLRPDYRRFLEAAAGELDERRYVLQAEHSPHWPMCFSKLRKNGTACIERYIPKDPATHCGIYIDIFPCDNLADGRVTARGQFLLSKLVIARALDRRGYDTDSKVKKTAMALSRVMPVRWLSRIVQRRWDGESRAVHTFFGASSAFRKSVFPREWFEESILMPFEGGMYPVSAHYDALLTRLYGDYMTPPGEQERRCKVHGEIIDPDHSYEDYWALRQTMHITERTRSIR